MGRDSLPEGLLSDVKNYLDITWDDEATDRKYAGLVASGMAYLDGKLGEAGDYTADGMPRTLLFEFVRHLDMQHGRAVKRYGGVESPDAAPDG